MASTRAPGQSPRPPAQQLPPPHARVPRGALATLAAQRVVVLWFDAPAGLALADGALIVIGMSATGAVFFARWMAVPAGLAAAGFLLWAAAPWTFPAAMVALGPAFMIVFGGFWRRDARRGVG